MPKPKGDAFASELEVQKSASMGQLLMKAARLYNERAIERVRRLPGAESITTAHTAVFPHLDLEGTRLTVLAQRMGVSKQFAGQLVEGLEALGLVERLPDETDGRAKLVRFTKRGKQALLHGLGVLGEIEGGLRERIGPARADALTSTLRDIVEALSER
ncbi:MAG: MarR family transcriptional regulator [Polyangiaceae bacterium]|nr:MarR family transcriptional regulator [Polyangiaceae bacterium]MBK8938014.1 MarR family transcriptional regulator [Polyangiaceae bacterium]